MRDLPLTFMIPVKMDTPDRERNLSVTTSHLLHNYNCKIIVTEADAEQKAKKFLPDDDRIVYRYCELCDLDPFHRTKYLNEMTNMADTECVANYDVDVMFNPESIEHAVDLIMKENADVVYPFGRGEYDQIRVFCDANLHQAENIIEDGYHINPQKFVTEPKDFKLGQWTTLAGHCQIFKRSSYFDGFLENENFISWGPEDAERLHRFETLGFDVRHIKGSLVYHLEHAQSVDSGRGNPHLFTNEALWESLSKMSRDDLIKYYESQKYMKKYKREMV